MGFLSLLLVSLLLNYSLSVPSGVYFEKLATLVHSSEHHNVVLRLEFGPVLDNLHNLDRKLQDAIKHVNSTSPFYHHFAQLMVSLRINLKTLRTQTLDFFETFEGYVPEKQGRQKRSNILGTLTARVLGLVTDDDLQSIIDTVNANSHKEEGIVNRVVSTMKITTTHLRKVDLAINKANLAVTSLRNHFNKLDTHMAQLNSAFVLAEALTFFTASVNTVERTVRQTLLDLQEVRLTGKVSSSLLPPSKLQKMLQNLLSYQLSLVFPPTVNYLPSYFRICSAVVEMSKLQFLIVVRVPLQTDSKYDLYRVRPFAVPYSNSRWSRRVTDVQEYFGIRADRKIALTLNNLGNCISAGDRFICAPLSHFISTTQQTCPIALFQESESIDKLCNFEYSYEIPTEFVKISDGWVGTSHSAQKAEQVCRNYTRSITIPAGLSSIPVEAGCKIITPDFVLPPFGLEGTTNSTIKVLTPPMNVTPLEHLKLDPLAKLKLQNLKPFKASELKFLKLRQAIYPETYWTSSNSSHLALTIVISFGLIAVAAYLTFLKCRSRMFVTNVQVRSPSGMRNHARLSPMNLLNRLPRNFSTARPPMPTPDASTSSSPNNSTFDRASTPFEPTPPLPATRAPTPFPSNARNTLQVPTVSISPPEAVEPLYLEMVYIFGFCINQLLKL